MMAGMSIAHPSDPIVVQRHTYGSHSEQFGELRLPPGNGPHPTIVYIHGGGWRAEITLAGAAGICTALTAQGYATWSIEYRRIGNGGGWPATFDDVLAAAAYVKTLAREAPLDLSRAYVGGQSAGGQLALWLASRTTNGRDPAAEARLPGFRGAFGLAPATDLRTSAAGNSSSVMAILLGGTPDEVSDRYAATSPIELAPIGVPQLLVHGTADSIVPYVMSERFSRLARAAGDTVELVTIDGADHLDLWTPASAAFEPVVVAVTRFLAANSV
jgi:acetyl esterase/lipase